MNSVKYPQLDATHWHTVSMQILFTLGSPHPFVSLYLPLVLSLSPSRFTWNVSPHPRPSLSPLPLSRNLSWKAKRCATHVCTPRFHHAYTHTPPLLPHPFSHFAPYHETPSFRSLCQFRHSHLRVISETKSMLQIVSCLYMYNLSHILYTLV